MTLTLLDIYNDVAGQAWSMFDGEVEDEGEFESSLLSSIQKALAELWCKYPYPFRYDELDFTTAIGTKAYNLPNGNIAERAMEGSNKYCVFINGNYLNYVEDYYSLEEASGTPTDFYIKNDKIYLHPTPDAEYPVNIEFLTLIVGKDKDGNSIYTVKNNDDVINVTPKYEVLFKNALITLSMVYAIASNSNQNYSSYNTQADLAYKTLVKYTKGIEKSSKVSW